MFYFMNLSLASEMNGICFRNYLPEANFVNIFCIPCKRTEEVLNTLKMRPRHTTDKLQEQFWQVETLASKHTR